MPTSDSISWKQLNCLSVTASNKAAVRLAKDPGATAGAIGALRASMAEPLRNNTEDTHIKLLITHATACFKVEWGTELRSVFDKILDSCDLIKTSRLATIEAFAPKFTDLAKKITTERDEFVPRWILIPIGYVARFPECAGRNGTSSLS